MTDSQGATPVQVTSGKDKGKKGEVLRVDTEKQKVFVEGLNIIKRHVAAGAGRRC